MSSKVQLLWEKLSKTVQMRTDKTFAQLTTIGCGGKVAIVAYPTTFAQLKRCVKLAKRLQVNYLVLGRGSNFLASDNYFDGMVICTTKLNKMRRFATTVWCQCGANTARVATFCAKRSLCGAEFMYCLPATVGGAVVMNAGCFGYDTSQLVKKVWYLQDGKLKTALSSKCGFGKRSSIFKNSDKIVVAVKLALGRGRAAEIAERSKMLLQAKKSTQPLGEKSFGSAFFNASGTASKLIDQAGLKNFQIGGAKVSNIHAGFVINIDKSSSYDIYLLLRHIKEQVFLQFGEQLTLEVQTVGFDNETHNLG